MPASCMFFAARIRVLQAGDLAHPLQKYEAGNRCEVGGLLRLLFFTKDEAPNLQIRDDGRPSRFMR